MTPELSRLLALLPAARAARVSREPAVLPAALEVVRAAIPGLVR